VLLAVVASLVAPAAATVRDAREPLRVVVVPGLELRDLQPLVSRGAVGLLVPGAGPRTSRAQALAALERGKVRSSYLGGTPSGRELVRATTAPTAPSTPAIVLGLPAAGDHANDRRYPIAVLAPGYHGLLTSRATRVPGLVSVSDVAPTALGGPDRLRWQPSSEPVEALHRLDVRVEANGDSRPLAALVAAGLAACLLAVSGSAAALAFATTLLANLALGLAGATETWAVVTVVALAVLVATPLAAWALRSIGAIGIALAAVVAAYFVVLAIDPTAVALSPLGPSQNGRFYGLSNLLSTLLLVPMLGAAALLGRRYGPWAFCGVGALSLVTVSAGRLGADGGGAVVLVVGLLVLAAEQWELSPAPAALLAAGAVALVAAGVGVDAATGATSHVTRAIEGGPSRWAGDLADRIRVSVHAAGASPAAPLRAAVVVAGIAGLVALAWYAARLPRPERGLPVAFAAAVLVSLVVNDSPLEVILAGLLGCATALRLSLETAGTGSLARR
jgi:hypothetical protein